LGGGVLWLLCNLLACNADRTFEPNLLLITADRLPADGLVCFGGAEDAGTSLCRLGNQGTLFGWTMTPGTGLASNAATVLTGQPQDLHGVDDSGLSFLSDVHETLAEGLGRVGYSTAAFVASPELNRSRRLHQGFDHYDDRLTPDEDIVSHVQRWIASAREPYFIWVQFDEATRASQIDRVVARLDSAFTTHSRPTEILFASLRGAVTGTSGIGLATHRVPMIWHTAKSKPSARAPHVSFALASIMDITPTLLASAGTSMSPLGEATRMGQRLDRLASLEKDRFLVLEDSKPGRDIGLASNEALYVRRVSDFDAGGTPIPTTSIARHQPRFMMLPRSNLPIVAPAALPPMAWREDVLNTDSPVPRLEFHLARLLREASSHGSD
jgi:Sulfatase